MRNFIALSLCLILISSCKKPEKAPIGYVDIYINLDSIMNIDLIMKGYMYFDLNTDGSPAGYGGIIVYKLLDTYLVYERACPLDHSCQVSIDESQVLMQCSCCESTFSVLDGSPVEGEAKNMLRQYRASRDRNYLYITN